MKYSAALIDGDGQDRADCDNTDTDQRDQESLPSFFRNPRCEEDGGHSKRDQPDEPDPQRLISEDDPHVPIRRHFRSAWRTGTNFWTRLPPVTSQTKTFPLESTAMPFGQRSCPAEWPARPNEPTTFMESRCTIQIFWFAPSATKRNF